MAALGGGKEDGHCEFEAAEEVEEESADLEAVQTEEAA
jgi:hypothetical protein